MSLRRILNLLVKGKISIEEAEKKIRLFTIESLKGKVMIDLGREFRTSAPEIIWAKYKEPKLLEEIIKRMLDSSGRVIISDVRREHMKIIDKIGERGNVVVKRAERLVVIKNESYNVPKIMGG